MAGCSAATMSAACHHHSCGGSPISVSTKPGRQHWMTSSHEQSRPAMGADGPVMRVADGAGHQWPSGVEGTAGKGEARGAHGRRFVAAHQGAAGGYFRLHPAGPYT